ncbi:MAG: hypothetical protein KDB53_13965, partial [Planctomycetes bacterium]|nr:hypothetical protein [Planctomycetota bacterium]
LSQNGHVIASRGGDAAPGIPGVNIGIYNNVSVQLNDSNEVAFQCTLSGVNVTPANDSAIYVGSAGNLQLVAREGDIAPGTGGGVFDSTMGMSMMMNGQGQVIFNISILGGNFPGSAAYSWDPQVGLRPLVLSGEMFEVRPGDFRSVANSGGIQFNNGDSRPLTFASDGLISLRINFNDGTAANVVIPMGALTTSSNEVSLSAGGTQIHHIDAGAASGSRPYLLLGTVSGTSPGISLGALTLPLNQDFVFNLTLSSPNVFPLINTLGFTNSQGRATAALITAPNSSPAFLNFTFHWAFVATDLTGTVNFVSNVVELIPVP